MVDQVLRGIRILVVEDEYFLADDLNNALTDAGAHVLGPAASVEDAKALIADDAAIDAAILDVNLRGDMVFPLADTLRDRGIPFAFATGYDDWALPPRFADAPRVEKPFRSERMAEILKPLIRKEQ